MRDPSRRPTRQKPPGGAAGRKTAGKKPVGKKMGKLPGPHYLGHRGRLKQRFLDTGPDALADYELLELLLFFSVPQGDVKPVAKALIERFGSLNEAIAAPIERLEEVPGIGRHSATLIRLVQALALRQARTRAAERPVISSWQALLDYCRLAMGFEANEQFRILFLDRKNALIADEVQQRGTINHTPLYPREVVKRALELGASAIILVHNHPSGDPTPSREDIDMTRQVREVAEKLGIRIHDHLVMAKDSHASFRGLGLL